MEKVDGRKLDHKTLEQLRIMAVKRVMDGESPEAVIKTLGFSRRRIYAWLAAYREGGEDALKAKKLFGRPPKLTPAQIQKLYRIIVDKNPLQLKFKFALWTREMVGDLIKGQFGVSLNKSSVGRLLKSMGLSPQKPTYRAYQQDKEKVDHWLEVEYPQIKALAKKEGAEIYFGDEAGVRSDHHSGTTWAPKGETPVVTTTGARFRLNLVSAVSPKGRMRFMIVNGRMDSDKFIEFLKRLTQKQEKPIFLIVDGHSVHRSGKVRKFVESTENMLRLFYLPPYSPQLNPDELVWNHLKNHNLGKTYISGPDDMKGKIISFLRSLQKRPAIIRGFFRAPSVRYAAEL